MEYMELGRGGPRVSVVGIGSWQWGSRSWGWGRGYGKEDVFRAVDRAHELGINFIDTAEIYGHGLSERLVGEAIRSRREAFVVATKVAPWHLHYNGVLKAVETSLRRLNIDAIDLYQIHWPNPFIPLSTTMKALEALVKQGKVRYLGVSNFSMERLQKAQELLSSTSIVSNQVKYNLLERGIEETLLPYCQREGIAVIAYSPLAQGLLTGKYGPSRPPKRGVRALNPLFTPENLKRSALLLDLLKEIAGKRGKTVTQASLNWFLKDPLVVPIPGVKNREQVEDIAGAADWRLSQPELTAIQDASSRFGIDRVKSLPYLIARSYTALLPPT